jgi:spermidine/putrescine ABC transporter ATP-binding subunit
MSMGVEVRNINNRYGDLFAIQDVNFHIGSGELLTLLGPSGCGKTTCLRIVAGFIKPTSGEVLISGIDVTSKPAHKRNTGMVFQSYALFPHKTVFENVAFGLKLRRVSRAEIEQRVREALRLVRLEDFGDRHPSQLSGGQRQRVALARAVVVRPEILLLDEPLAALDLKLREEMQIEIKRIQSALNITTLFVTHDQGEALSMSDNVAVMRNGKIVQLGKPSDLYQKPESHYVASFIGSMNLLTVIPVKRLDQRTVLVRSAANEKQTFAVASQTDKEVGTPCLLAVRPECIQIAAEGGNSIRAEVASRIYKGSVWSIHAQSADKEALSFEINSRNGIPAVGDFVMLTWRPEDCFLLDIDDTLAPREPH